VEEVATIFTVTWNNDPIGTLTISGIDMGYIDTDWKAEGDATAAFLKAMENSGPRGFFDTLEQAPRLVLTSTLDTSGKMYCLAMLWGDNVLTLRMLTTRESRELFFPDTKRG
jgi:hypothetical protein